MRLFIPRSRSGQTVNRIAFCTLLKSFPRLCGQDFCCAVSVRFRHPVILILLKYGCVELKHVFVWIANETRADLLILSAGFLQFTAHIILCGNLENTPHHRWRPLPGIRRMAGHSSQREQLWVQQRRCFRNSERCCPSSAALFPMEFIPQFF